MSTGEDWPTVKPLEWVGSSLDDLKRLPVALQRQIGHNLYLVQTGMKPDVAKPLAGFGGASVLEIVAEHTSGTYRAIYTVKYREAVYVLHVFQKKSKKGIKTPKPDVDAIKARLKTAAALYKRQYEGGPQ